MKITEQGLVQVTMQELLSIHIGHFYSAADPECAVQDHQQRCGTITSIGGLTEWVGASHPMVSIGWDWQVNWDVQTMHWHRVNPPRSNIQVLNSKGVPLSWEANLDLLATWVDAQCWVNSVAQVVSYAAPQHGG